MEGGGDDAPGTIWRPACGLLSPFFVSLPMLFRVCWLISGLSTVTMMVSAFDSLLPLIVGHQHPLAFSRTTSRDFASHSSRGNENVVVARPR